MDTLDDVDKVRLGRALGYGTRHAARTVAAVVEAATAPDPAQRRDAPGLDRRPPAPPTPETVIAPPATPPRPQGRTRTTGRALWAPLATYSNALWHRVTGLFFAMVAVVMAGGAWRQRGAVLQAGSRAGSAERFWLFLGLVGLFGYFAISSFVRAARRERRAS